jgi:hypothetical protein
MQRYALKNVLLLREIQLTLVQRFNNCTFIHYCCDNTEGKSVQVQRTLSGVRERHLCSIIIGLTKRKYFYMNTPFSQLNLSRVEHV